MLTCVAVVMHLGNMSFKQNSKDEAILADEASYEALAVIAELLEVGISPNTLTSYLHKFPSLALTLTLGLIAAAEGLASVPNGASI